MHEAVRQGDAQGNSPDGTVEHARVAMPAFFGELDAGEFVDAAVKDEKVRIADFGTSAASGTLLPVDQRRPTTSTSKMKQLKPSVRVVST